MYRDEARFATDDPPTCKKKTSACLFFRRAWWLDIRLFPRLDVLLKALDVAFQSLDSRLECLVCVSTLFVALISPQSRGD